MNKTTMIISGTALVTVSVLLAGSTTHAEEDDPPSTADVPGPLPVPDYVTGEGNIPIDSPAPVIRVYKDFIAWQGENRDSATLSALGKILGQDWFIHPVADCRTGIPAGTAVVLFTSNSNGNLTTRADQIDPLCQNGLATFLSGGGVLIVDMGDNDVFGGFEAPGATGTPNYVFPNPCNDVSLTTAAAGPDSVLGTADDHPLVKGPDGVAGTADDLTNTNIDFSISACAIAHGNLADGIALPADATSLITAVFGEPKPVAAEYCFGRGRVIVDTMTKEFFAYHPAGLGPSSYLTNLLSYALSPAAPCVREVEIDIMPNTINLRKKGVIPVAILSSPTFDATTVDPSSVCFGDAEAPSERDCTEAHGTGHIEDVNDDGLLDLVLHFENKQTGIDLGDTQACLTGEIFGRQTIEGCDAVLTVGS